MQKVPYNYQFGFVETRRKFNIAKLSIRKLGSSAVLMPIIVFQSEKTPRA